jgi:hypothetical protein
VNLLQLLEEQVGLQERIHLAHAAQVDRRGDRPDLRPLAGQGELVLDAIGLRVRTAGNRREGKERKE